MSLGFFSTKDLESAFLLSNGQKVFLTLYHVPEHLAGVVVVVEGGLVVLSLVSLVGLLAKHGCFLSLSS